MTKRGTVVRVIDVLSGPFLEALVDVADAGVSDLDAALYECELIEGRWDPWRSTYAMLVRSDVEGDRAQVSLVVFRGVSDFSYSTVRTNPIGDAHQIAVVKTAESNGKFTVSLVFDFDGAMEVSAVGVFLIEGTTRAASNGIPNYGNLSEAEVAAQQPSFLDDMQIERMKRISTAAKSQEN